MLLKGLIDEDFVNYRKPSMFLSTTKCSFKCCKEAGLEICQNLDIINFPNIEINNETLVDRYLNNPITNAIVIAGLEPFDTFEDMHEFIIELRKKTLDDIVIYTGYYPEEIQSKLVILKQYPNIIIKFGRFIPNQESYFNELLGVKLSSQNQFAEKIS